ncbi:MAG TPA: alpha/beta hydrolase [Chthoniobacterales bacterium]|nr:alpha/beta hydrolase [Chthoniobacterales bacterium]
MKKFLRALVFITMTSPHINLDAKTLTWSELGGMPLPAAGERITYGNGPQQFGELRVPSGPGPFPVMIVIHGGCWQNEFDYVYMTRLAEWLTEHGVATWTIEYRRLGDAGGGWPGTFLDVADGTDALRGMAEKAHLDLKRVFATGHSAGGHLALWLASRGKLPKSSELYRENPVAIQGVLGLAAITNLEKYRIGPPNSCHSSVEPLLGGGPDKVSSRYAETSPSQRLPIGVRQIFIQGEKDPIVEAASVREYVEAAKKAGDHAEILPLAEAGHFEACVPLPQTASVFEDALRRLMSP